MVSEGLSQFDTGSVERKRTVHTRTLPKRFYENVSFVQRDGEYDILLDGSRAKTPARQSLTLPNQKLAVAVVSEWQAQEEYINPATMPLTRLVNTVIDRVSVSRESIIDDIVGYSSSDMLFYRAEEPEELRILQNESWDHVLLWATRLLGVSMPLSVGVVPVKVMPNSLKKIRTFIEKLDDLPLGAVADLTCLLGSCLLAMALFSRYLSPDDAWQAAHVDENWQIAHWGLDTEVAQYRDQRRLEMDTAMFLVRNSCKRDDKSVAVQDEKYRIMV